MSSNVGNAPVNEMYYAYLEDGLVGLIRPYDANWG
jgi:hypothetical protein